MNESFGDWLLEELGDRGWTTAELCSRGRIHSGTLSNIINGRRNLGIDIAPRIARGLNIPEEEVLRQAGLLNTGRPTESEKTLRELGEQISILTNPERLKVSEYVSLLLFRRRPGDLASKKNDREDDFEEAKS